MLYGVYLERPTSPLHQIYSAAEINDPLNDVAYACWMWCDIGNDEVSPIEIGKKIKVILDAYQLCKEQRNLFNHKNT